MVVIVLEKCPLSLRGDLTKWLQEISMGVFVGRVSARVRDRLWDRICSEAKGGRATMVFTAQNEQHLDFRVHNTTWEPIDFDGMKLMMRPSSNRLKDKGSRFAGKSDASRRMEAKKRSRARSPKEPDEYVVVDMETTGLNPDEDSIIEIGAVKIINGEEADRFQALIDVECEIPEEVTRLTGIDAAMTARGLPANEVVNRFLDFIGPLPLVMHNADFDMDFIDALLCDLHLDELDNECIDTLKLARKKLPRIGSRSLESLASYFELGDYKAHRALDDALKTRDVFVKLIEL